MLTHRFLIHNDTPWENNGASATPIQLALQAGRTALVEGRIIEALEQFNQVLTHYSDDPLRLWAYLLRAYIVLVHSQFTLDSFPIVNREEKADSGYQAILTFLTFCTEEKANSDYQAAQALDRELADGEYITYQYIKNMARQLFIIVSTRGENFDYVLLQQQAWRVCLVNTLIPQKNWDETLRLTEQGLERMPSNHLLHNLRYNAFLNKADLYSTQTETADRTESLGLVRATTAELLDAAEQALSSAIDFCPKVPEAKGYLPLYYFHRVEIKKHKLKTTPTTEHMRLKEEMINDFENAFNNDNPAYKSPMTTVNRLKMLQFFVEFSFIQDEISSENTREVLITYTSEIRQQPLHAQTYLFRAVLYAALDRDSLARLDCSIVLWLLRFNLSSIAKKGLETLSEKLLPRLNLSADLAQEIHEIKATSASAEGEREEKQAACPFLGEVTYRFLINNETPWGDATTPIQKKLQEGRNHIAQNQSKEALACFEHVVIHHSTDPLRVWAYLLRAYTLIYMKAETFSSTSLNDKTPMVIITVNYHNACLADRKYADEIKSYTSVRKIVLQIDAILETQNHHFGFAEKQEQAWRTYYIKQWISDLDMTQVRDRVRGEIELGLQKLPSNHILHWSKSLATVIDAKSNPELYATAEEEINSALYFCPKIPFTSSYLSRYYFHRAKIRLKQIEPLKDPELIQRKRLEMINDFQNSLECDILDQSEDAAQIRSVMLNCLPEIYQLPTEATLSTELELKLQRLTLAIYQQTHQSAYQVAPLQQRQKSKNDGLSCEPYLERATLYASVKEYGLARLDCTVALWLLRMMQVPDRKNQKNEIQGLLASLPASANPVPVTVFQSTPNETKNMNDKPKSRKEARAEAERLLKEKEALEAAEQAKKETDDRENARLAKKAKKKENKDRAAQELESKSQADQAAELLKKERKEVNALLRQQDMQRKAEEKAGKEAQKKQTKAKLAAIRKERVTLFLDSLIQGIDAFSDRIKKTTLFLDSVTQGIEAFSARIEREEAHKAAEALKQQEKARLAAIAEAKKLEEQRKAAEAKKLEEARLAAAAEAKKLEDQRKAAEARKQKERVTLFLDSLIQGIDAFSDRIKTTTLFLDSVTQGIEAFSEGIEREEARKAAETKKQKTARLAAAAEAKKLEDQRKAAEALQKREPEQKFSEGDYYQQETIPELYRPIAYVGLPPLVVEFGRHLKALQGRLSKRTILYGGTARDATLKLNRYVYDYDIRTALPLSVVAPVLQFVFNKTPEERHGILSLEIEIVHEGIIRNASLTVCYSEALANETVSFIEALQRDALSFDFLPNAFIAVFSETDYFCPVHYPLNWWQIYLTPTLGHARNSLAELQKKLSPSLIKTAWPVIFLVGDTNHVQVYLYIQGHLHDKLIELQLKDGDSKLLAPDPDGSLSLTFNNQDRVLELLTEINDLYQLHYTQTLEGLKMGIIDRIACLGQIKTILSLPLSLSIDPLRALRLIYFTTSLEGHHFNDELTSTIVNGGAIYSNFVSQNPGRVNAWMNKLFCQEGKPYLMENWANLKRSGLFQLSFPGLMEILDINPLLHTWVTQEFMNAKLQTKPSLNYLYSIYILCLMLGNKASYQAVVNSNPLFKENFKLFPARMEIAEQSLQTSCGTALSELSPMILGPEALALVLPQRHPNRLTRPPIARPFVAVAQPPQAGLFTSPNDARLLAVQSSAVAQPSTQQSCTPQSSPGLFQPRPCMARPAARPPAPSTVTPSSRQQSSVAGSSIARPVRESGGVARPAGARPTGAYIPPTNNN